MVANTLKIKCGNHNILTQIKEILLTEDDFGRKIFTMQKLLPLVEENYTTDELSKYDLGWNMANHGIVLDIISDLVLEENDQLIIHYHSLSIDNYTWFTVLGNYLKSLLPKSEDVEIPPATFEHTYYELDRGFSGHYYWDGTNKGKPYSCGLIDFAAKHHPGLLYYLKIQHDNYSSAKKEATSSSNQSNKAEADGKKNNSKKNDESWKK